MSLASSAAPDPMLAIVVGCAVVFGLPVAYAVAIRLGRVFG